MPDLAVPPPSAAQPKLTARAGFAADRVVHFQIADDEAGQRIDNYLLVRAKGVPKSHVYRVIRGGEVRVNKKRVDADYRLATGDSVRLPPMRVAVAGTNARDEGAPGVRNIVRAFEYPIVFEDDDLLVIDKPAGVAVHGGSGISFGVIEQLRAARPTARFIELVHRLDRDTSGLLMIAKKRSALVRLHEEIREGRLAKRYVTCVAGDWNTKRRQVKAPLVKFLLPDGERRVRVDTSGSADAMPAHTIFDLVERFRGAAGAFALLDVDLKTGRTHQIRVHLAHLGFPIVGDEKYGDFAINKALARSAGPLGAGFKRMFLHAARLTITHPRLATRIDLSAPLPVECTRFLDVLRASAGACDG